MKPSARSWIWKNQGTPRTDCHRVEAGGNRHTGGRGHPADGDFRADVLSLEEVYRGLGVGELRRPKQLEDKDRQLKQLVADLRARPKIELSDFSSL